ncbi:DMT family transporter [Kitasatospora sp. NPDC001539]|uniref:DMT family transporter n=1 Tax=unclassified Kitasatospora TaxID=2633591 RepID=UPI00332E690B
MTVLLALSASLLCGLGDFGGGVLTRRLPALAVVVASQTAATVALLLALPATGGWADLSPALWYAVAAGAIGPFAMLAFYRALALGPMGVVSPLATVGVAVPVGVGLALGERPGPVQLAGIVVALAGVVLAGGPERGGPSAARTALVLTLAAAFGFGANMALLSQASAGGGLLLALCAQRLVNIAVGGAALVVSLRGTDTSALLPELRSRLPLLTGVGLADVAANAAYAAASHGGSAAVAAVLASLYPVVTALLARGVLKERLRPVQVVGAGLAVAGTLLLASP